MFQVRWADRGVLPPPTILGCRHPGAAPHILATRPSPAGRSEPARRMGELSAPKSPPSAGQQPQRRQTPITDKEAEQTNTPGRIGGSASGQTMAPTADPGTCTVGPPRRVPELPTTPSNTANSATRPWSAFFGQQRLPDAVSRRQAFISLADFAHRGHISQSAMP